MAKKKEVEEMEVEESALGEMDGQEVLQQLAQSNQQLQTTAQNALGQLQNYVALCSHYEQTINILTGRLQELQRQLETKNKGE
jgi:PIN domain nuclease of toxin-antitoxin system|tara:strand:+ start:8836 stop:9084 length:249 start_codon:yes stop_codon:yes gene_type:complete